MKAKALFPLLIILLVGFSLLSFLGGNRNEGFTTNTYNGPRGGQSASVTTNQGNTYAVAQGPHGNTAYGSNNNNYNNNYNNNKYDNYNHYTGTSYPNIFYGPDGGTARIIQTGNDNYIVTTYKNGTTEIYYITGDDSNNVDVNTYYGPNGASAKIITDNDGNQALEVTGPNNNKILYTEDNTYTYNSPNNNNNNNNNYDNYDVDHYYGRRGGSATTVTGPQGNTAGVVTGPNGNTYAGTNYDNNNYNDNYDVDHYYGRRGGSATTVTGPQGNTAGVVTGPNGNTYAGTNYDNNNYNDNYNNNYDTDHYYGPRGGSATTVTGPRGNTAGVATGPYGNTYAGTNYDNNNNNSQYYNSLPSGVSRNQIPRGQEDLYILKSEVVPPVCPACPTPICPDTFDESKCQPCPPCSRCPEPAFDCKKVPNYKAFNADYLPVPVLNDFSGFGM